MTINEGNGISSITGTGETGVTALIVMAIGDTVIDTLILVSKVEYRSIPITIAEIVLNIIDVTIPELANREVVGRGGIVRIDITAFEALRVVVAPAVPYGSPAGRMLRDSDGVRPWYADCPRTSAVPVGHY